MSQIEPLSDAPKTDGAGGVWRAAVVAVVLIGVAVAVHLTPLKAFLAEAYRLRDDVDEHGVWVWPVAVIASALMIACGVPRLPIHAAGGMIFGFALGLLLTLAGAILGHYAVFLFIRWGGRDWALRRWPVLRRWADVMREHGVIGVILARQLPAHAMIINAALALSQVQDRHFLVGTALGLLPEAVPATLIGAGLIGGSLKQSGGYLVLAAAAFAVIWIVGGYTLRALRKAHLDAGAGAKQG